MNPTICNVSWSNYATPTYTRDGDPFVSHRAVVDFSMPGTPSPIAIGKAVSAVAKANGYMLSVELDRTVVDAYDLQGNLWGKLVSVTFKDGGAS